MDRSQKQHMDRSQKHNVSKKQAAKAHTQYNTFKHNLKT